MDADKSTSFARDEPRQRRPVLFIGYLTVTGALAGIAVGGFFFIPKLVDLYESFGAELSGITSLLIASAPFWGLLPVLSATIAFYVWKQKKCSRKYRMIAKGLLVGFVIIAVAIVSISLAALHLPVIHIA